MATNISSDGWVTPDLAHNPSVAADVATSSNPINTGIVASHALKTSSVVDAVNDNADNNGTQSFWARTGHWGMNLLNALNKPLQEVQKDYKFLHSVYVDHGNLEGFIATLGVLGGAVGGFAVGGFGGAMIGSDLAAAAERNIATKVNSSFKDSYAKSEDVNYKVSPGRDFSNALAEASGVIGAKGIAAAFRNTDSGLGKVISGISDATFDIKADPFIVMGNFAKLMRGGGLLKQGELEAKYPLANAIPGIKNFLLGRSNVPVALEQMDMIRKGNAGYSRAIDDIAAMNKSADGDVAKAAGNIVAKYPELAGAAGRLAEYTTPDDVHSFFKTAMFIDNTSGTLGLGSSLPTKAWLGSTGISKTVADALADKIEKMPAGKYTGNVAADAPLIDKLRNAPDQVMGTLKNLPGNLYKSFTGYLPYSIDSATGKLSRTQFRWDAPDAPTVIYRIAKGGGLGEVASKQLAGEYAKAVAVEDIKLAREIKNRTIFETFKSIGLPEDSKYVDKIYNEVHNVDVPKVSSQIYEVDENGNPLGKYDTATGQRTGGMYPRHTAEMWNIPDLTEAKAAMRQYGKLSKAYSNFDDFVGDWYTKRIFKPLALANVGFALRVSAAEIIPAISRFGVSNMFKASLAKASAKSTAKLAAGEGKHIFSAALTGLGIHEGLQPDFIKLGFPAFKQAKSLGLNYAAKMLAPEQLDVATRIIVANDAHYLKEANAAGHNGTHDFDIAANYYHQIKSKSSVFKSDPEWTIYSKENPHYLPAYATSINKSVKSTPENIISKDIQSIFDKNINSNEKIITSSQPGLEDEYAKFQELKNTLVQNEYDRLSAAMRGEYKAYNQDIKSISRATSGDLKQLAEDRVSGVLGKVIGSDGTYHPDLIDSIANKKSIDINTIRNKYNENPNSLPKGVAGPVLLEPPVKNMFTRIIDGGFKKVLDPIVNGMSREPLYTIHVADELGALKGLVNKGFIDDEQALSLAQQRAVVKMMPQIHNVALRSNFSETARNFLPFYFAQEQALKRAFWAMKDTSVLSPLFSSTLRYYQLAEHALSNPAFVETDGSGNRYIYIPFGGALGEGVQKIASKMFHLPIVNGLPMSVTGNATSLKSVLPELNTPGVSPFMAISGNLISDLFPNAKSAVKGTVGDIAYNRGFADTVFPSTWMKNIWNGLTDNEKDSALASAIASAMAAAYYHKQFPSANATSDEQQAFAHRIVNNAKSALIVKGVLGLLSPLAPRVQQEDPGLRAEFWNLVKQKGNMADAWVTFAGEHGNDSISYTVARTESLVSPGSKIPITQKSIDFIKQHQNDLFKSYPVGQEDKSLTTGAYYLVPQNIKSQSDVNSFNEMMKMNLRANRTPNELIKQTYIAAGWQQMDGPLKAHVAAVQSYKYDSYDLNLENQRWSAVMDKMKNVNPIWYESYAGSTGKVNANRAYNQLSKIFQMNVQPDNEQSKLVGALLSDYQHHAAIINQYKQFNIQGVVVQQEKDAWQNHLLAVSVNQPQLDAVIKSVFSKLD